MADLSQHEDQCCEWEECVPLYALGNLAEDDLIGLEQHLAQGCARCSAELSRAGEDLIRLAKTSSAAMPAGARERFLARLRNDTALERKATESSIVFNEAGVLISRSEAMPWQPGAAPGIWIKALFADADQHCITAIVRMDPGVRYPSHRHTGAEELFLLSGDVTIEGKLMKPGDYCHAEPESIHGESFTRSGCTFMMRASTQDEVLG
ncbi:MAG: hypothetical protein NVS1B11_09790 [Terriglobales bacterium]